MDLDKSSFDDINQELEYRLAEKKATAEQALQKKLASWVFAPETTHNDRQQALKQERERFWKTQQVELDEHKKNLEARLFENHGGSREAAQKQAQDHERAQQKQAWTQQDNTQQQQKEQNQIRETTQKLREEKEKKDKLKKEHEANDNMRKQNQQQSKKQDIALKRDRLKEQFNNRQPDHGRNR